MTGSFAAGIWSGVGTQLLQLGGRQAALSFVLIALGFPHKVDSLKSFVSWRDYECHRAWFFFNLMEMLVVCFISHYCLFFS